MASLLYLFILFTKIKKICTIGISLIFFDVNLKNTLVDVSQCKYSIRPGKNQQGVGG
jgi:hypothetical protein